MASFPNGFDSIVIGGGSAGLAFSRKAASHGAKVLLVEADKLGGTCVNRGCVPKKLLWKAAHQRVMAGLLSGSDAERIEFADVQDRVNRKLGAIRASYAEYLEELGVMRLTAHAELAEGGVVAEGTHYAADHVVLANGARPAIPDALEGRHLAVTSDDVLAWTDLPRRVVFLGGGYIGCELASILAAFGVETRIVDEDDGILTQFRTDLAERAAAILTERGIELCLRTTPRRLEKTEGGLRLTLDDGRAIETDAVVAAVGRTPNVATLGPMAEDLARGANGALAVSEGFETSRPGVFAIGDIADRLPLTPVATRDGETLARRLAGDRDASPIDLGLVTTAAFVMPPLAQVGTAPENAGKGEDGHDLADGALAPEDHWSTRQYRRLDRTEDGRLASVGLMADGAPDMIAPFAALLAAEDGLPPTAATGVHPSFGEETVGR